MIAKSLSHGSCCVAACVLFATGLPAEPPARFQGDSLRHVEAELPIRWSPDSGIAWTAPLHGYGQSAPIVAHDQIVVTSTSGANKDAYHVSSFAGDDGELRWRVDFSNPSPFKNTPMVSRAAPSAVATEDGFVAFFEGGLLAAISPEGETVWQRNLVDDYGPIEARHGLAASLESDEARIYVWVERTEAPYVLAIDPCSGGEVWKSPGVGSQSWASPRLIPVGDARHLVLSGNGKIVGLEPDTGVRLWEFDAVANNNSCTPMPAGDGAFLIGASDGRGETESGAAAASNGLIEIKKNGDGGYHVDYRWRAEKATCTFGSPVVAGETAAIVNRAGVLYRLDLQTGKQLSVARTAAGGIWATPLVTGDHIYLFGYQGTTAVISLDNDEQVAENRCWVPASESKGAGMGGGGTLYAAAVSGDRLFLRRGDAIYAIDATVP